MSIAEFLKPELIWTQADVETSKDVFETVYNKGMEHNFVNDHFLEKISEREQTFPTGLQLDGYGVAIPHTDPDCIKEQFIAVLLPKEGVPFKRMDDASQEVDAKVIFVLGLNEPHSQLTMLQELMGILQEKEVVQKLRDSNSKEEVIDYLGNLSK
ncbi:PTS sugar transporter subunit IIA [Alkalibacterium putridalgicola]|uniref:PTS sugar transporter subunit IIA n=1 Tax=Alkalibacterium putridalgicola TaxID=426703 RepID=UPI0034CE6DD8